MIAFRGIIFAFLAMAAITPVVGSDRGSGARVGRSADGPDDQRGRLSMMTDTSRARILARIGAWHAYDLGVPLYVGMPSFTEAGDPPFQKWMTHTPSGFANDDPLKVSKAARENVTYTGDAITMYTHTGTHIDGLGHFGLHGEMWNGVKASEHLGDKGWSRNGVETIAPIVARGVLIDVAAAKGLTELPDAYRITADDLRLALGRQRIALQRGDVILVRTGRMAKFRDAAAYMRKPAGLGVAAARTLVEAGAMIVGIDSQSPEVSPSGIDDNYMPVHTFLLGENGVLILENVDTQALARDRIYEFAFIGAPLKIEGGTGSPLRPIALPLRPRGR